VKEIRKGEVTKDTTTVAHAVTDYSPRWYMRTAVPA
jgi:hypothetical protein